MTSLIAGSLSKHFSCRRRYVVRAEAEFLQQVFQRCRRAETPHADDFALRAGITFPSEYGSHLYRNARGYTRRKDALLIRGILMLKQFPRWHAYDFCFDAFSLQFLVSVHAERDFASAGHQDHL